MKGVERWMKARSTLSEATIKNTSAANTPPQTSWNLTLQRLLRCRSAYATACARVSAGDFGSGTYTTTFQK
jgi:hypothetical protein